MDTTFDKSVDSARSSGRKLKNDAADAAGDLKSAASSEIKSLIADVEDLVAKIGDLKDSDVAQVRGKVLSALDAAKSSVSDRADSVRRQAQRAASTADGYVRESPWAAVGVAALVGAVVGILATRRS